MNRSAVAFVAVVGSLTGTAGVVSANVEIGGVAGVHFFADDNALGTKKNDPIAHSNSSLFALRVSATFVGQDKVPIGSFDYLNDQGLPVVNPVRDGRLVDGAFIAKVIKQPSGVPSLVGRIFSF